MADIRQCAFFLFVLLIFHLDCSSSQGFPPARFPLPGQAVQPWPSNHGGGWGHGRPMDMIELPGNKLFSQSVPVGAMRQYFMDVPKGGSVSITVHPRRGHITWNITYQDVTVMRHPFFTHRLRAPYKASRNRGRRSEESQLVPHSRQKRWGVRGAVRANFDFDVPELNAGLGQSLGPGSITYLKEDTGGRYILVVHNRGAQPAEFFIYSTLDILNNPFPRSVGDPQAKVEDVTFTGLSLSWMPIPEAPMGTQYCVFYHNARAHVAGDVHSSPYASYLTRPTAVKVGCTQGETMRIVGLQRNQEYHIDVFSQSPRTKLYTTYLGVRTTTDHRSYARSGAASFVPNVNDPVPIHPVPGFGGPADPAGHLAGVPPVRNPGVNPIENPNDPGTRSVLEVDNRNPQRPAGAFNGTPSSLSSCSCLLAALGFVFSILFTT